MQSGTTANCKAVCQDHRYQQNRYLQMLASSVDAGKLGLEKLGLGSQTPAWVRLPECRDWGRGCQPNQEAVQNVSSDDSDHQPEGDA